jgi:uncharacterized membrane protein YeaQ/YmgE (transglycosylase-associated protein family)
MTIEEVAVLVVMAVVLGVVSQKLLGYRLGGLAISMILGFIGAFVGREIGNHVPLSIRFNLQVGDTHFPVLWSFVGALGATFVAGLIAKSAAKSDPKKK